MLRLVDELKDYEAGHLDAQETLELFAELVRKGEAWTLQESYARTAKHLIDAGYITPTGEITQLGRDLLTANGGREGSPCDVHPRIDAADDVPVPRDFAYPNVRRDEGT